MRSIWLLLMVLSAALRVQPALAQVELSAEAQAKALFDQGLVASDEERWADAAALFEHSRSLLERPSTVFNLLGALYRLGRYEESLQLVEHYLSISDPVADASRRQEVEALREGIEKARAKVVITPVARAAPTPELPTVRDLELTRDVSSSSELAPSAPTVPDRGAPPKRRRRRALWITSSLIVVGVLTTTLLLTVPDDGPNGPPCGADTTAGRCLAL